jgi:adenosylmethionine-8-amino-7-oxononanoate aminotransferase
MFARPGHINLTGESRWQADCPCEVTPPGLSKCFFTDNGSSAVEVALRMSFYYWRNRDRTGKTRFVTLSNSYHGETPDAQAVGDVALYKQTCGPLLMESIRVPSPDCFMREPGETCEEHTRRAFEFMDDKLQRHADEVCAVIVEPLVYARAVCACTIPSIYACYATPATVTRYI